ncbi:hypothetical protein EDD15DRAFT_2530888 [Pisolithus albus]|nr:hypothetical protein EDD15DRAFT_2530888 [Pisolithus albus]
MAAKGNHRLLQQPRFPLEVWEYIFELATHVPCTLVPELYEKSDRIDDQRSALQAALATKRSLVLVCKRWQYMTMRYLYRIVLVRTGLDLLALDRTFRNYATGNGGCVGTRSPGQWTRRLDITLDLRNECEDLDRCVKHLTYVIKSLPKLEIVSFTVAESLGPEPGSVIMPFRALDALRSSANSLRILHWSGSDFFPQVHQLEELLRDLPNLRVLRCYQLVWANGIIPSSILSSLTTLAVSGWVGRLYHPGEGGLHDACVSLREFIYYEGGPGQLPQEFPIHYGKYLTVVKWYLSFTWHHKELDLLLKSSLNLDRLTISLYSLDTSVDSRLRTLSFPCVSYLGVKLEVLTFEELFRFLTHLRNTVPTLRVFQLVNPPIVARLMGPSKFSTELIVKNLNENPFRVEDDEGNLLSDRLLGRSDTDRYAGATSYGG